MASTPDDLFGAIEADDVAAVQELLEADPSLVSARDAQGVSPLMRARYRQDRALAHTVLERVAALDVFEAAAFGDVDRLTVLLAADVALATARSGDGFTPLHLAAFWGKHEAVALLLARGADVDARGEGFMTGTALHSAASGRHLEAARALLEAGADPNARQEGGFTPLHAAAMNGDAALAEALLANGADPSVAADDGRTSLAFAEERGDAATIALLRE